MQTASETYLLAGEEWVVRVRAPQQEPIARTTLLLHGLQGNEDVMWIFSRTLSKHAWLFAPRAILPANQGFSWVPPRQGWPTLDDFARPCQMLIEALDRWAARTGAPAEVVDVMGFSQGAALSYALAAFFPQRIGKIMALAGFLPAETPGEGRYSAFQGKEVYIAHGTRDETVPVSMAEESARALERAGATVQFCTSDVGHKLGANCLKGIEAFLGSSTD